MQLTFQVETNDLTQQQGAALATLFGLTALPTLSVTPAIVPSTVTGDVTAEEAAEKPKRKRRTKAQIAADKAAEEAAAAGNTTAEVQVPVAPDPAEIAAAEATRAPEPAAVVASPAATEVIAVADVKAEVVAASARLAADGDTNPTLAIVAAITGVSGGATKIAEIDAALYPQIIESLLALGS